MRKVNPYRGKCAACHDKPSMAQTHKHLDAEQKHWGELCNRCYRSMHDASMARELACISPTLEPTSMPVAVAA